MSLKELELRHKELDQKINEGYSQYLPDMLLNRLKKEKLRIKTLISRFK